MLRRSREQYCPLVTGRFGRDENCLGEREIDIVRGTKMSENLELWSVRAAQLSKLE